MTAGAGAGELIGARRLQRVERLRAQGQGAGALLVHRLADHRLLDLQHIGVGGDRRALARQFLLDGAGEGIARRSFAAAPALDWSSTRSRDRKQMPGVGGPNDWDWATAAIDARPIAARPVSPVLNFRATLDVTLQPPSSP